MAFECGLRGHEEILAAALIQRRKCQPLPRATQYSDANVSSYSDANVSPCQEASSCIMSIISSCRPHTTTKKKNQSLQRGELMLDEDGH
jgi:hypothetical protein